jgi:hypothetical protein
MAYRPDSSSSLCIHLHIRTGFRDIDFCHDRLPSGSDWLLWTRGEPRQYDEATREFDTTGLRTLRTLDCHGFRGSLRLQIVAERA